MKFLLFTQMRGKIENFISELSLVSKLICQPNLSSLRLRERYTQTDRCVTHGREGLKMPIKLYSQ